MFIKFEGRLLNARLITMIEKDDIVGCDEVYMIYIHAGISSVSLKFNDQAERDKKYEELESLLYPKYAESTL